MPPVTPTRMRATAPIVPVTKPDAVREADLRRGTVVRERQLAPGDLLHRHRQVVLRARLDERRGRVLQPETLSELMVLVVDLPSSLRGHDDERVPRRRVDVGGGVREELVDTRFDHRLAMVPASTSSRSTIAASTSPARVTSSFLTM